MPITTEEQLFQTFERVEPEKVVNYLHCLSSEEAGIDDINLAVMNIGLTKLASEDLVNFALSVKAESSSYQWEEKLEAYAAAKGVSPEISPLTINSADPQTRIRCANSSVFKEQFAEMRQQFLEEMKAKDQVVRTAEEAGQDARDAAQKAFTSSFQSAHGDRLDEKIPEILSQLKARYNLSPAEIRNNIADVQTYLTEISKDTRKILPKNAEDAQILLGKIASAPDDDRVARWDEPDNYGLVKPYLAYAWAALNDENNLRNKEGLPNLDKAALQNNLKETMMQQFALLQNAYALEGSRYKGESTSCAKGSRNAIIETLDGYHSDINVSRSFAGASPTLTLELAKSELQDSFLEAVNINLSSRALQNATPTAIGSTTSKQKLMENWHDDLPIVMQPGLNGDQRETINNAFNEAETQLLAKYKTSNNKYYSEIRGNIQQNLALPTRELLKPEVDVLYEYKRMLGEQISSYQDMHDAIKNGGSEVRASDLKRWLDDKEIKSPNITEETLAIAVKNIKPKELTSLTNNILNREYDAFKAEFDQKTPTEQLDILFDQERTAFASKGPALQAAMSKRFDDSVNIPYSREIEALWGNPTYKPKIAAAIFDGSIGVTEHLSLDRAQEAYTINNTALNEQLAVIKALPRMKQDQKARALVENKLANQDRVIGALYEAQFEKTVTVKEYDKLFEPNSNEVLEQIRQSALKNYLSNKPVLIKAIQNEQDIKIVEKLLAAGANIDAKNSHGNTALIMASVKGRLDVVNALLTGGAEVNAANKDGNTALMAASQNGHLNVANALLASGAEVNAANKDGITALMLASENGHLDVANALLAGGAEVNAANKDGITALIAASLKGPLDVANALLAGGADLNAKDKDGETALMIALKSQNLEIVNALINKGADVNAANKDGETALIYASLNSHLDVANSLLAGGADVNAKDNDGNTALIIATTNIVDPKIIEALLAHDKIDVNAKNNDGKTALMLTIVTCADQKIVKALLAHDKIDVNAKNNDGKTALMIASRSRNLDIVKALIDKGADVNVKDKDGKSAMDWARNEEIKSLLLEAQKVKKAATKIQSLARGIASRKKIAEQRLNEMQNSAEFNEVVSALVNNLQNLQNHPPSPPKNNAVLPPRPPSPSRRGRES